MDPDMTLTEEDNIRMRDILYEISKCQAGVVLNDPGRHVLIQIDKDLWKRICDLVGSK